MVQESSNPYVSPQQDENQAAKSSAIGFGWGTILAIYLSVHLAQILISCTLGQFEGAVLTSSESLYHFARFCVMASPLFLVVGLAMATTGAIQNLRWLFLIGFADTLANFVNMWMILPLVQ